MHNNGELYLDVKVNMADKNTFGALSSNQFVHEVNSKKFLLRPAAPEDALSVHKMVEDNPPLDPNSLYCNLLQCSHFADTSVAVELDGQLVAFMTGYIKPHESDVLFVWQMAVSSECRGHGLAGVMLNQLVQRHKPRFIETTVTESNKASSSVFERFVQKRAVELSKTTLFDRDKHFGGRHDSEILYRIGPISY